MTFIDRKTNGQFPGRKKRETNVILIRPRRTVESKGANMSNKSLRMSNFLVKISIVLFLLAVSFWLLRLFDVNFYMIWILMRTILRKCLHFLFSRLGWGWKGAALFHLVTHCVEWIFSFMEGNLTLYVGSDGASSSKRPPFDLNLPPSETEPAPTRARELDLNLTPSETEWVRPRSTSGSGRGNSAFEKTPSGGTH